MLGLEWGRARAEFANEEGNGALPRRRRRPTARRLGVGLGVLLLAGGGGVASLLWSPATAGADVVDSCATSIPTGYKKWVGPANGAYETSGNWSPSGVPSATSLICAPAGSSIVLASNRTVTGANLQGSLNIQAGRVLTISSTTSTLTSVLTDVTLDGTIAGTLPVELAGANNVLHGSFTGTGVKSLAAGASASSDNGFTVGAAAAVGTFKNAGTITWTGFGHINVGGNGSLFQNLSGGTINMRASDGYGILDIASGATKPKFVNDAGATIERSVETGSAHIYVAFDNNGTAKATSGSIQINNGNTPGGSDAGTYNAAAGNTVTVANGTRTFASGASVTGAGGLAVNGGTVNFPAAAINVSALQQAGGTITGSSNITGTFGWNGGIQNGTGTTTLAAGAVGTSSDVNLAGSHVLNIKGSHTWTGFAHMNLCGTSQLQVDAGGTLLAAAEDGYAVLPCGTGSQAFVVKPGGTFERTPATGSTLIQAPFDNQGTVKVDGGDLQISSSNTAGGSDTGTWNVASGALASVTNGTRTEAGSTFTGTGTYKLVGGTWNFGGTNITVPKFHLAGGTLTGTGTIGSSMVWDGGTISGAGTTTIGSGVSLTLPGGGTMSGGHVLKNEGTTTWDAVNDHFNVCSNAVFRNAAGGVLDIKATGGYSFSGCGTNTSGGLFNEAGALVKKSGGLDNSYLQLPIQNDGTIRAEVGGLGVSASSPTGSTGDTGTWTCTGGSLSLDAGTHLFNGGKLSGACTYLNGMTITGTPTIEDLHWWAGTFAYPGTATVTGTLRIDAGIVTLAGKLLNQGTVKWSVVNDHLNVCNPTTPAVIENASGATFELTTSGGYSLIGDCGSGSTGKFINQSGALVVKRGPVDNTWLNIPLDNFGTIRSESGGLAVGASSISGSTGDTGTWTTSGSGVVGFNSGTRRFNGGTITGNSYLNGMTMLGTPNVDHMHWWAGTIDTTATANVTGLLEIDAGLVQLNGKIHNTGTVTWSVVNDHLNLCGTSQFDNDTGGTFEITGSGGYSITNCGSTSSKFTNRVGATIVKKTGADNQYFAVPLENDGTVSVQSGGLTINKGSVTGTSDSGTYAVSSGAGLAFQAGTRDFTSAATVNGPGDVYWNGGALTGSPTFDGGPVHWTAAGPSGTGTTTLGAASTLNWNPLTMSGGHVVARGNTHGPVNDHFGMSNGATFTNEGTFHLHGDGYTFGDGGGADPQFTNAASGVISADSGANHWSVPTHNAGTIRTPGGDLQFSVAGALDNYAATVLTGGTYDLTGGLAITGANVKTLSADVILRGTQGGIYPYGSSSDGMAALTSITGSGSLTADRDYALTTTVANAGTISVTAGHSLSVGGLNQSAGKTNLAAATSNLVVNGGTGTATINGGSLTGVGTVQGNVTGTGSVSPGTVGLGRLSITGNLTRPAGGTTAVDIKAATSAGVGFDQVAVTGTASLGGTLALTVDPSYVPQDGDTFAILAAGARTGTFASVTGFSLPNDRYLAVHYTPSAVALTVTPLPLLSIGDVSAVEGTTGDVTFNFPVTLSDAYSDTVTVPFSTDGVSASDPADYIGASGTVTFPANTTTQNVSITVKADTLDENSETFRVNLGTPTNAGLADNQAIATIQDDPADGPVAVSVDDPTVTEGDAGNVTATFHVTLAAPSGKTVTVDYASNDATASAADYTGVSGTVTFGPGQTSKDVAVAVKGDTLDEPTETFTLDLAGPTNATLGDAQGIGTILDNGDPGPTVSIGDAAVNEGDSGTVSATFPVSLSGPSGRTVTVPWSTADDSATSPSDYAATSGTVTLLPGDSGTTVTVQVNGDAVVEPNETFLVNLGTPTNAAMGDGQGQGTIVNDDTVAAGPPDTRIENGFAVADLRVVEGDTASFTVVRKGSTAGAATVKYATANVTAVAGVDYGAVASTVLSFASGEASKTVNVSTSADSVAEPNETFKLSLSSPTGGVVLDASATATIDDPGAAPATLSVGDLTVAEGGTATFTVVRSGDTSQTTSVQVDTANGTALAPTDFAAITAQILTFAPGETSKAVSVPTTQNGTDVTKNLTFSLKLSKQAYATLSDAAATATILDDEGAPIAAKGIFVAVDDLRVTEGDAAVVTLRRRGDTASTAAVKVATGDTTAKAASDYAGLATTVVTFGSGETFKTVSISTTEDAIAEQAETFQLKLAVSSTNAVIEDSYGLVTINDDDQVLPQLTIDDVQVREGKAARFTITRSGDPSEAATVKWATSNGTALAGSDYAASTLTTLTFAPGEVTKFVDVPTTAESRSELFETFRVALSAPTNVVVADSQGTATIIDAGSDPATFTVDDISVAEGSTAAFTVVRRGDVSEAATVKVATANGTAFAGTDYDAVATTVVAFAAGETSKVVHVPTIQNATNSVKNLTFSLKLSSPTDAYLGDATATATVVDDEGAPVALIPNFLSIGDVRVDEGGSAVLTITRRGNTSTTTSVKVGTLLGASAAPGSDYTALAATVVTFSPGQTTATVSIATLDDAVAEPAAETFAVSLTSPATNATAEDNQALVTIVDND